MSSVSYLGVWGPGSGAQWWVTGVSAEEFTALDTGHFAAGLRLVDLSVRDDGFTAVWQPGTGAQWVRWGLDADAFAAQDRTYFDQGLRLQDICLYGDGLFAGVWRPGDGDQWARWGLTAGAFTTMDKDFFRRGMRLTCLRQNGPWFAGVWRPGGGDQWAHWGLTYDAMRERDREYTAAGLRLWDAEVHDGLFTALWRPGEGAQWWAYGDDLEKLIGRDTPHFDNGLRITKLYPYTSPCRRECVNQVLQPMNNYFWGTPATTVHCRGLPGTCGVPASGDLVRYWWPCLTHDGSRRVIRLSAMDFSGPPIFTLPFTERNVNQTAGWLYKGGYWHHAIDFSMGDGSSFPVRAAAGGTVLYMGWDNGAGNTIVISHPQGGTPDAFRTIYVHLRGDPDADVTNSWARARQQLAADAGQPSLGQFEKFLTDTGNPEFGVREPDPKYWGTQNDRLDFALVGQQVARGQIIGHAGLTGTGGCGCLKPDWTKDAPSNTHLHIVFARRDPSDGEWYIIDPYGIYATQDCYPPYETDISASCARYPSAWAGNRASFPF